MLTLRVRGDNSKGEIGIDGVRERVGLCGGEVEIERDGPCVLKGLLGSSTVDRS